MWDDERNRETQYTYGPYRVEYQPRVQYYGPPEERGIKFSREELEQIGFAIFMLTLAFTIAMSINRWEAGEDLTPLIILIFAGMSFGAIGTGFFLHEMGHKYLAQRYGCWAEFRSWKWGLFLAIFTAFMGFLFAAPGAVYIRGHITKAQNGKISAFGPLMNITVAIVLLPLLFLSIGSGLLFEFLSLACFLNLFLAGFNMIPFPPLDGSKIMKWNIGVWIGMLIFIGALGIIWLYITGISVQ
jgi:Zn-dependent protease